MKIFSAAMSHRLFLPAAIGIALSLPGSNDRGMAEEGVQVEILRERIVENHFRFIPPGDGPFPTIVAIPGCSGIAFPDPATEARHPDLKEDDRLFRRHYLRMAERLRAEGFAILLIHVHGAEGLVKACSREIEYERIAQYIDEAVAWAQDLDFVDATRIHVVGWSMGGGGTLAWLHGDHSQTGAVRSVVTVYPACSGRDPLAHRSPLLMLLGGADDITDASVCQDLVAASPNAPTITVRSYLGARHGFDIEDAPPVLDIGNGMTVGHQRAAAEAAWREILAFLSADPGEGGREVDDGSSLAFVDVHVVPMDAKRIIEHQTVVVVGSRIVSVGPVAEQAVPANALRIEGGGLYLMPGLADMHAHVDSDRDLTLFLANGVTTVRNMAGSPEHLDRRDRVARGEVPGPTMYTAGPIIDGPTELWPGNAAPPLPPDEFEVITTRGEGERVVREQAAAGYDFVKVYDNITAEAYDGVISAASQLGLPVAGHVPFGVGLERAARSGLASNEHLRGYIYELFDRDAELSLGWDKRSRFLAWNHIDATRVAGAVATTVDADLWNVPTLTRYQKNMMPAQEHLSRYTRPESRYLEPAVVERLIRKRSSEAARYGAFSEADFRAGRGVFAAKKALVKALHDGGARLLLGSDDWFGGFATHEELQNLVAAGLSPFEALTTGTTNAATFLGAADEVGVVAVGMRADLLLLEENPLLDVAHARSRAGVMVRGRWYPESELQEALDRLRTPAPAPGDP